MKNNRAIGLISAVPLEGSRFVAKLHPEVNPSVSWGQKQPLFYSGRHYGCNLAYGVSGLGKVNAAHAATLLINHFTPSLIINLGIGGAYPSSGLDVGSVAIATKEIYADEGVWLKDGLKTLETVGIPLVQAGRRRYFNEFPMGDRATKKILTLKRMNVWEDNCGFGIRAGAFATVSACTGTKKRAAEIEKRLQVICENMEGAAVAHICALYGIPLVEIRGISNMVEERNRDSWDIAIAAEHCQIIVVELLREISKTCWGGLV
jgi:futalosine hydrolase